MSPLPKVQIIGAQKAGTSAVADWLFGKFNRPHSFPGEPHYYNKEVHFFDDNVRYGQGIDFYRRRFKSFNGMAMDATPDTLAFAERVHKIYEEAGQLKKVKILIILRDPISRELSLYNHLAYDCRTLDPFEKTVWHNQVIDENKSIMDFTEFVFRRSIPALTERDTGTGRSTRYSLYAKHLRKWFDLFDRKQILVLSYNEMTHRPQKFQERIQAFLGCTIPGVMQWSNDNDSDLKVQTVQDNAKEALEKIFTPHNEKLYELLESYPGPSMEQCPFPRF